MPNQKKLQWSTWLGGSRNLDRMGGGVDKQVATLQVGVEDTIKAILKLPGTTHEVQSKGDRFCLDAWPVTTGESTNLFITIHGEFLEGVTLSLFPCVVS
jgi:nuclear RNA export factor